MFRLITRGGGLMLAGVLLPNNGTARQIKDDVQSDNNISTPSWWNSLKDRLQSIGYSDSIRSQKHADQKYSETYVNMVKEIEGKITGWDRLKEIFVRSDYKPLSNELGFVIYVTQIGAFAGFMYGGMREYAKTLHLFLYTNDAAKYASVREATAALARAGVKGFFKGGLLTSPKCAILSGIFISICTAIAVFRGKSGIIEYVVAGGATTSAMKCNLGIRGMISGFVSGGLTGLVLGSILYFFSTITNTNFNHARYYAYLMSKREEMIEKETKREEGLTSYEMFHNEKTKHLPIGFSD